MREDIDPRLSRNRLSAMPWDGLMGAYQVQGPCGESLRIVASMGETAGEQGWEHVSVSTHRRTPNWIEMCFVKDLFWRPDETVMQLHPPRDEWISNHPYCLHMWRHKTMTIPMPPSILVGRKDIGDLSTMSEAQREVVRRKWQRGDYR